MPEIRKTVVPVKLSYTCDACNEGSMQATGHVLPPAEPKGAPKFLHKCDKCGATADLDKQYPHVNFEDVPE